MVHPQELLVDTVCADYGTYLPAGITVYEEDIIRLIIS